MFTSDYEAFLALLVETRKRSGYTQTELGCKIGESQSWVSKAEQGVRRVDIIELINILEALEVSPSKFIHTLCKKL